MDKKFTWLPFYKELTKTYIYAKRYRYYRFSRWHRKRQRDYTARNRPVHILGVSQQVSLR